MTLHPVRMMQRLLLGCASGALLTAPALAQQAEAQQAGETTLQRLEESVREQAARIEEQSRELERQRQELADQQATLKEQLAEIARLKGEAAAPVETEKLPRDSFAALRAGQA